MKVISGKSGKILTINKLIENYDKVLVVTRFQNLELCSIEKEIVILEYKDNSEMWNEFIDDDKYKEFINGAADFDVVVFYGLENEVGINIDNYGAIEDRLSKEVIVTIQNDSEEIKVLEI